MFEYMEDMEVWMIIAAVLSIVGAILVYVLFLNKKNEKNLNGFKLWLYDFLSFKVLMMEVILKICYLILAIFVTLISFGFIGQSFLAFLLVLIGGNIVVRLVYEFSLMFFIMCRNLNEINRKIEGKETEVKNIEE